MFQIIFSLQSVFDKSSEDALEERREGVVLILVKVHDDAHRDGKDGELAASNAPEDLVVCCEHISPPPVPAYTVVLHNGGEAVGAARQGVHGQFGTATLALDKDGERCDDAGEPVDELVVGLDVGEPDVEQLAVRRDRPHVERAKGREKGRRPRRRQRSPDQAMDRSATGRDYLSNKAKPRTAGRPS